MCKELCKLHAHEVAIAMHFFLEVKMCMVMGHFFCSGVFYA